MKSKRTIAKFALMMGISVFALTACESSPIPNWFDDDPAYTGDVKPPKQTMDTVAATGDQIVPPPSQEILQSLPPAAPQPTPQFTSSLGEDNVPLPVVSSPNAPPAPAIVNNYTGNLASVPPRPSAAELPSPADVQAARAELRTDNQQLANTLRDPYAGLNTVPDPLAQKTVIPPQQQPSSVRALTEPVRAPAPPVPMPAPAPVMPQPIVAAPMQAPQPMVQPAPMPTEQNVGGRLMGLQSTGPGKYALVQLPPETGIGSFAMAASIVPGSNNQITNSQYQDLRRVAGQYVNQKGRVRLVAYGSDPQSQDALRRVTTVAAYLVDLGVPANAIRLRIDPVVGNLPPTSPAGMKTDVFLEVPVGQ